MYLILWISKSKAVLCPSANSWPYWFASLAWLLKGSSSVFGEHLNFLGKKKAHHSCRKLSSLWVCPFNHYHIMFTLRDGKNPTMSQLYPLGWLGIRNHICSREHTYLQVVYGCLGQHYFYKGSLVWIYQLIMYLQVLCTLSTLESVRIYFSLPGTRQWYQNILSICVLKKRLKRLKMCNF